MSSLSTLEAPVKEISQTTKEAITTIQEHLDKEARNRRQISLSPRDLCPMQKAELIMELWAILK